MIAVESQWQFHRTMKTTGAELVNTSCGHGRYSWAALYCSACGAPPGARLTYTGVILFLPGETHHD